MAARFEFYLDGIELANGFHELSDAREQRDRFTRDLEVRRARGQAQPPLDERLLAALEVGIPDCAGVALGFDRLVAIAVGATRLSQAIAFPIDIASRTLGSAGDAPTAGVRGPPTQLSPSLPRDRYSPVRVSMRRISPSLMNSGTRTMAPVSSFAGFEPPVAVSPRTPGSVSITFSSMCAAG